MKYAIAFLLFMFPSLAHPALIPLSDRELSQVTGEGIVLIIENSSVDATATINAFNDYWNGLTTDLGYDPIPWNVTVIVNGAYYPSDVTPVTFQEDGSITYVLPHIDSFIIDDILPGPHNVGVIEISGLDLTNTVVNVKIR